MKFRGEYQSVALLAITKRHSSDTKGEQEPRNYLGGLRVDLLKVFPGLRGCFTAARAVEIRLGNIALAVFAFHGSRLLPI